MRIKFVGEAPLDAEGEVEGKALSFHLNPGYVYDLTPEQVAVLRKLDQEKYIQRLQFNFPLRPVAGAKAEAAKPKDKDHGPGPKPDEVPELPKVERPEPHVVLPSDPFPANDSPVWDRDKKKGDKKGDKKPR